MIASDITALFYCRINSIPIKGAKARETLDIVDDDLTLHARVACLVHIKHLDGGLFAPTGTGAVIGGDFREALAALRRRLTDVAKAQHTAIELHPELARIGSRFHTEFIRLYNEERAQPYSYLFSESDWPATCEGMREDNQLKSFVRWSALMGRFPHSTKLNARRYGN